MFFPSQNFDLEAERFLVELERAADVLTLRLICRNPRALIIAVPS